MVYTDDELNDMPSRKIQDRLARADLDIQTAIRWRLLCLYKDISVIISHSIAVT